MVILRPASWLALLSRTFTFELSLAGSPRASVEYNYVGKQSIPTTGLSPASPAALWAADPDPDSFRPQNQRSRPQNPQQTRPQPLWIGVREAGPPIRVQEARGDIPGPCLWVTVCSGMGEGAIRGGYWGGRRAVGGEMDTAARCGAGFSGCQDHPWDSLN